MESKEGYDPSLERTGVLKDNEVLLSQTPEAIRVGLASDLQYMDSFQGIYPDSEINYDKSLLVGVVTHHYNQDQERGLHRFGYTPGDDLEYLIKEKAELNCWLGEDFLITGTSKYADIMERTDAVAETEIEEEVQRMALTIDCTIDHNVFPGGRLTSKLEGNFRNITSRKNEVKYFESQIDGRKGSIFCVPVVLGLENFHVTELMDHKNDNRFMAETPAQVAMLREVRMQLEAYTYLLKNKGDIRANSDYRHQTLEEIERISGLIDGALVEKMTFLADRGINGKKIYDYLIKDQVYMAINDFVAMAKK